MKGATREKRNITPEQAVKILEKNGLKIDENEAGKILDFIYFLSKLIVKQNFKK